MNNIVYKYDEDKILQDIKAYIDESYKKHYTSGNADNIQPNDLLISCGHGTSFFAGNVVKYAARFGKKDGKNLEDLKKLLHYAILLYYVASRKGE